MTLSTSALPSVSRLLALISMGIAILVTGCSLDVLPVHYSRVKSAQQAHAPIQRGPDAPGAFKKVWTFAPGGGYRFDPSRLELTGVARFKPLKGKAAGKFSMERDPAV